VLIVDDNSTNLKVAEGLLSPYMMSIDTCKSGEESVARARENEYDLVLMDHMMPGIDGIEAAHVIRALGGWRAKLPIVALTANAVSGMREMFLKNGFDDFLSKPIEIAKLNRLIEKWVPEEAKRAVSAASATNDAKDQPVFPEISGLDVAAGIAITGGTVENYRSVLEIYCRDAELRVASVNLSKAQDDLKNFTANVHALKSASASIGANALSEEAAYLEDAGKRGDTEAIRERVDAFRGGVSDLIGRIQRMDELK
jgi:CheY-like chemotaxis protein